MGAYMSKPNVDKVTDTGANKWISYSSCSMQGWRMHQEDAHNCIPDFDSSHGVSFFAVYDGHGGSEVARYCAEHMPNFLTKLPAYGELDMKKALKQLFLDFDATLVTPETRAVLNAMSETDKGDSSSEKESFVRIHYTADDNEDDDEEDESYSELLALRAEANEPLEQVLEKYGGEDALPSTIKSILDTRRQKKVGECSHSPYKPTNTVPITSSEVDSLSNKTDSSSVAESSSTAVVEAEKIVEENSAHDAHSKTDESTVLPKEPVAKEDSGKLTSENPVDGDNDQKSADVPEDADESDDESADFDPVVGLEESEDEEEEGEEEEDEEEDDEDEDEDDDDDDDEVTSFSIPGSVADTEESEPGIDSGTTACVAVLVPLNGDVYLYVANAGDSRAVLCRGGAAVELSVDHKPEDEDEKARILAAGGTVTRDGRVNGGLNLSRALGDHSYKQTPNIPLTDQMITPSPDVTEIKLVPSADEFLVIACDGVWNSMTSQEVVEFIQDRLHPPTTNDSFNTNSHSDTNEKNGSIDALSSTDKLSKICHEIFDHCLARTQMVMERAVTI
ncbi:unnamed protein product [Heterobilharzia americana]|nr:unnamed protein product [Heterobilharzia americana]